MWKKYFKENKSKQNIGNHRCEFGTFWPLLEKYVRVHCSRGHQTRKLANIMCSEFYNNFTLIPTHLKRFKINKMIMIMKLWKRNCSSFVGPFDVNYTDCSYKSDILFANVWFLCIYFRIKLCLFGIKLDIWMYAMGLRDGFVRR